MLKGKHIVCISMTTWRGPFTKSTVQLMSRLASQNKVLFVEYPFTLKDLLLAFRKKEVPWLRMLGLKNRLSREQTIGGDATVFQWIMPPVFPVDFIRHKKIYQQVFRLNVWLYQKSLKKGIKRLKMSEIIFIAAYNPLYGLALKGKLNERLHVYYAYDGPNIRRHGNRVLKIDTLYAGTVDAVIASSDMLAQDKKQYNKRCFVVKNGVDFDMFSKRARIQNFKSNNIRVGYIGNMDFRFDIDMVETTVKTLTGYAFEFIGNVRNAQIKRRLSVYPNVLFRSPVKPHKVPACMGKLDVGIIPYLQNQINTNIYPLKLNEYLAMGIPVVMTQFANLSDAINMVSIAKNAKEFIQQIKDAIAQDTTEKRRQRMRFASKNSWDTKAEEFSGILEYLLQITN
jgi:teichuronic acid biosynthesis glycosyltransferase TuaH